MTSRGVEARSAMPSAAVDRLKLDRRAVRAETDHVAVLEHGVGGDPAAVHKGAVAAAEVLQHEALGLADDGRVPGRHVEVALGVEAYVGKGVAAEPDVAFAEGFHVSRPGAGEKLELGFQ